MDILRVLSSMLGNRFSTVVETNGWTSSHNQFFKETSHVCGHDARKINYKNKTKRLIGEDRDQLMLAI